MTALPNCQQVLSQEILNIRRSVFDGGVGQMYLVEATGCWTDIMSAIDDEFEVAQANIQRLKDLHIDTTEVEKVLAEIEVDKAYTSGLAVYTQWQWDEVEMAVGDAAGLCWYQEAGDGSQNYASCWAVTKTGDDTYDAGNSYLIDPTQITEDMTIADLSAISLSVESAVGLEGSWQIVAPQTAFATTKVGIAMRFLNRNATSVDPALSIGEAFAITYQTTTPPPPEPEPEVPETTEPTDGTETADGGSTETADGETTETPTTDSSETVEGEGSTEPETTEGGDDSTPATNSTQPETTEGGSETPTEEIALIRTDVQRLEQAVEGFAIDNARFTSSKVQIFCYNEETCYVPPPPEPEPEPEQPKDDDKTDSGSGNNDSGNTDPTPTPTPTPDPTPAPKDDDVAPEGVGAVSMMTIGTATAAVAAMFSF